MEIDLTPSTPGTCVESSRSFGQLWYPVQNCYKKPTYAALPTPLRPGDGVGRRTYGMIAESPWCGHHQEREM